METSLFSFALSLLLLNTFTLISSSNTFNISTDQYALLAFKNSITSNTSNGVWSNNWFTNTSICSWAGVSCGSKHSRVTALNVSGLGLVGPISPRLGNLTFLRSLDLSSNNFTGPIPSELSNLRRLEVINVGFNFLTGEIPSWFGALSRIKRLNLRNNTFSGSLPNGMFNMSSLLEINMKFNSLSSKIPDDICSNTSKLKRIDLLGNQLFGEIPKNIYKCRELEDLRLGNNNFSGSIPSEIGSLSMLGILYLHGNNFEGSIPSSIFNMSSLQILDLYDNSLSGSIPNETLYNLPVIEEIYLNMNYLTGGIPKQFGNLISLTKLELANNQLTGELPEELANLPNLEVFSAAYNTLSGSIPTPMFNMSSLRVFSLQQNFFSGSLPSSTELSLPNLQELYLHYNRLTGQIPSVITNASQLTILELNRNSMDGVIPSFSNLRLLTALRLWENKLTGLEFITSLTNCQYLEVLEITDNQLNDVLPASIGNISSLVTFRAAMCNINGGIPIEIGNLNNLQTLDLSENKLTGLVPATIGQLKQLVIMYVGGNQLQGYIPFDSLCQMSNLGYLNMSLNMFTGPIHECLGEVGSLRLVSLASNRLNSSIPLKFWNLVDLTILDLSVNNLSGQVSSRIGNWKINQLDLSSNQFSGDVPSSIGDCLSLEYLSLSDNNFGGIIPETLGDLSALTTLNLSHNSLSGLIPKSLVKLRTLENFDVSYNKLEGEIPNEGRFGNFSASSFVNNSALCGATRFQVRRCNNGRSRWKSIARIMKYVVPSFIATIILVVVIIMLIRRRKQTKLDSPTSNPLEKIEWKRISYIELTRVTSSFSETSLLGRGSYGSVFKGTLSDGLNIAIKVFNLQLEAASKSFYTESEILSSIRHRNLVPIIGCCTNAEFKALILKYMPNGSLEKWLHSDSHWLDLVQRLKIAKDVALALEYLHHGHTFPVVHCDIKPSNVLIDEDMTAHVADFGISKLFDEGETMIQTTTLATVGYAAPEYGSEGKISTNGDVYSFGILLLEMFTRKKPTNDMFNEDMSLKEWVSDAIQENAISEVVAPSLLAREEQHFSMHEQCVSSIFDLAMKCLAFSPKERMNMVQVVAALQKIEAKVTPTKVNNTRSR